MKYYAPIEQLNAINERLVSEMNLLYGTQASIYAEIQTDEVGTFLSFEKDDERNPIGKLKDAEIYCLVPDAVTDVQTYEAIAPTPQEQQIVAQLSLDSK